MSASGGGNILFGGGAVTGASARSGSAMSTASSSEANPFEIVFELPPGVSISGNSAFIRQVTVPEPSAIALVVCGTLVYVALRSRNTKTRLG
jgi:hypothetical protein